jgi:Spy/CpxP family protein refolding chaperone
MHAFERLIRLAAVGVLAALATTTVADAAARKAAQYGYHAQHAVHHATPRHVTCSGEFMYWHDGKCLDARDKNTKSWMQGVF